MTNAVRVEDTVRAIVETGSSIDVKTSSQARHLHSTPDPNTAIAVTHANGQSRNNGRLTVQTQASEQAEEPKQTRPKDTTPLDARLVKVDDTFTSDPNRLRYVGAE